MKLCIFDDDRIGLAIGQDVVDITDAFATASRPGWPYPKYDWVIKNFESVRPRIDEASETARRIPLASVRLRAPVANPGKIIAAPINYKDHIAEANNDPQINHGKTFTDLSKLGVFLKANSSVIGCHEEIRIPFPDRRTDHEVELAVVIGREAKRVSRENALDFVFGYCIGLDMTVRGPELPDFRKSADTFSVLGPWVVTADEIPDPNSLDLSICVNGKVRQQSNTSYLVYNVQRLIEYASAMYTLYPGDVIMTGTPAGVSPVTYGDVLEASVSGIGTMTARMAAD
ncbi:Maleylpyruvate hydrolase [Cupriavidus necator]|uniref:fumarylacetoacetate hydrolase family protein n=1 Tax=Cupriavidus necator TaxID=106590 RepID=UPI003F734A52